MFIRSNSALIDQYIDRNGVMIACRKVGSHFSAGKQDATSGTFNEYIDPTNRCEWPVSGSMNPTFAGFHWEEF